VGSLIRAPELVKFRSEIEEERNLGGTTLSVSAPAMRLPSRIK
jgi:hypothetical protein